MFPDAKRVRRRLLDDGTYATMVHMVHERSVNKRCSSFTILYGLTVYTGAMDS